MPRRNAGGFRRGREPGTEYHYRQQVKRELQQWRKKVIAERKAAAALQRAEKKARRANPGTTIRGWVKAKAVKIVRNKRGQAVSVKIRT